MSYREIRENRLKRFMKRVRIDVGVGCWEWTGPLNVGGYGVSCVNGVRMVAHRAFWVFCGNSINEFEDLDHLCRNRSCINPNHLERVTRSENLRRGFEARGCKNGHPFGHEAFSIVRRSDGGIERRCKICHRARNKKHKISRARK